MESLKKPISARYSKGLFTKYPYKDGTVYNVKSYETLILSKVFFLTGNPDVNKLMCRGGSKGGLGAIALYWNMIASFQKMKNCLLRVLNSYSALLAKA